jgi:RNA polymerase-binding transcription factor DksA
MEKHSPEFISEMKSLLQEEQKRLKDDLEAIAKRSGGEYKANFPDYGRNDEDNATEIGDYTATASTESTLEERLRNVEAALERINQGNYGITAEGELIPQERLRANPAATTTVKQQD